MILIGLTGSIGMGKSTTAKIFAEEGCAVWDADAAVHRLYSADGAAAEPLRALFPDAVGEGGVDRAKLRDVISADPSALKKIEAIVHPLVAEDRARFIAEAEADVVVLDVPLLFETGGDARVDYKVVVSTTPENQRARVLARGTMTEAQFEAVLAKQMPDAEKRVRADFVVETETPDMAKAQVREILKAVRNA